MCCGEEEIFFHLADVDVIRIIRIADAIRKGCSYEFFQLLTGGLWTERQIVSALNDIPLTLRAHNVA
jgi:hypothetical protein